MPIVLLSPKTHEWTQIEHNMCGCPFLGSDLITIVLITLYNVLFRSSPILYFAKFYWHQWRHIFRKIVFHAKYSSILCWFFSVNFPLKAINYIYLILLWNFCEWDMPQSWDQNQITPQAWVWCRSRSCEKKLELCRELKPWSLDHTDEIRSVDVVFTALFDN